MPFVVPVFLVSRVLGGIAVGDVVRTLFVDADREWADEAQERLLGLALPTDIVRAQLQTAAAGIGHYGQPATEVHGSPQQWATQQVNDLAEQGQLRLRPLAREGTRTWVWRGLGHAANIFGQVGVLQLLGFAPARLTMIWLPILIVAAAARSFGERLDYYVAPRSSSAGLFLSALGCLPTCVSFVALWIIGPRAPGFIQGSAGVGFLDGVSRGGVLASLPPLPAGVFIALSIFCLPLAFTWSRGKLAGLFNLGSRPSTTRQPTLHPVAQSNRHWKGEFRRLAYYRWHLSTPVIDQLEQSFSTEPGERALRQLHGTPQDALAWTAPVYRDSHDSGQDKEMRGFRAITFAWGAVCCVFLAFQACGVTAPWWLLGLAAGLAAVAIGLNIALVFVDRHANSLVHFTNETNAVDPIAEYYGDGNLCDETSEPATGHKRDE